jgi:hypothetical protein
MVMVNENSGIPLEALDDDLLDIHDELRRRFCATCEGSESLSARHGTVPTLSVVFLSRGCELMRFDASPQAPRSSGLFALRWLRRRVCA